MAGLVGLVVYDGVRRENAGAAVIGLSDPPGPTAGVSGAGVSGATTQAAEVERPGRLRVATFNIASGRGTDGRVDLSRTLATLREAAGELGGGLDVVGLQEVRRDGWGDGSQVEDLAASLVMRWAYVPSERRWWREHFGNAVMVSRPAESVLRVPLPQTQERGQRNVAVVRVRVPAGDGQGAGERVVTVLVTHIDRRVDQPSQLRFVTGLFRSVEGPAVLMGDLNVLRDHPILRELVSEGAVDATVGFPGADAPGRIDHVFVRGLVPVSAGAVNLGASDHPLIWAELAFPGGSEGK